MIQTSESDDLHPLVPLTDGQADTDFKIDLKLYKSLSYLSNFCFIEKDNDGLKMRLKEDFFHGEFPFQVGYVIVSEYDDRQYLISKIDPFNGFVWFGLWEE